MFRPLLLTVSLLCCWSLANGQTSTKINDQTWIQGGEYRLKIRIFKSDSIKNKPILVVVIHGDSPSGPPDYQNVFAAKVAASNKNVVAVGLLRPGYTDV